MPDGEPLPQSGEQLVRVIGELLFTRAEDIVTLEPGVYDVTPKVWTNNTHRHELTVLDNGTGLYRLYPRYGDAGYRIFGPGNDEMPAITPGGRVQPLDDNNRLAIVAGGHPRKQDTLQMFEILLYTPALPDFNPEPTAVEVQSKPEQTLYERLAKLVGRFLKLSS
jgi:hypothetical protein